MAVGERQGRLFCELWPTLDPLYAQDWERALIDMPIGFKQGKERRQCDLQARGLLGKQRSSVFFAPPRELIGALDYEEVRAFGMSLQTFYLLPKIRELDERAQPSHQAWLSEAHPELAYRSRWNQDWVLEKKRTALGREQRQTLLEEMNSPFKLCDWSPRHLRREVALDDYLDAALLLEVARQEPRSVGGSETDSRGLRMEISY